MKSLEEYLKEKHPEIIDEYNNYAKEAKIVDKEKADKERAKVRSQHRFWHFDFTYTVKESIYDEEGEEKFIPFNYAFNLFSNDELAAKLAIVKPGEEGYENSKSLIEIIKEAGVTQSYIKKEFKKFLYNVDYTSLWMYVDDRERHYENITWDGKFYWDKSHYEEIWNDLMNCRFIEKELEEDF